MDVSLLVQHQKLHFLLGFFFPFKSVRFKCACYWMLSKWYNSVVALNLIIQSVLKTLKTFASFVVSLGRAAAALFGGVWAAFALCPKVHKLESLSGCLNDFWMNMNWGLEVNDNIY